MAAPEMDPPPPPPPALEIHVTFTGETGEGGTPTSLAPLPRHSRGLTAAPRHLPGVAPSAHPRTDTAGSLSPTRGGGTPGVPAQPPGGWHMGVPAAITGLGMGVGGETPTPPGPTRAPPGGSRPLPGHPPGDPANTAGDEDHPRVLRGVTGRGSASALRCPSGTWHRDRPPPTFPVRRSLTVKGGGGHREPPHALSPTPGSPPSARPARSHTPTSHGAPPLTTPTIPAGAARRAPSGGLVAAARPPALGGGRAHRPTPAGSVPYRPGSSRRRAGRSP